MKHRNLVSLTVTILLGLTAIAVPSAALARGTLQVNDQVQLHIVKASGSLLTEAGYATGTLPGTVRGTFRVNANVSATLTLYPGGGGSISMRGRATLLSSGRHSRFRGTVTVTGGSGRYAHARGTGKLSGVFNRHTKSISASASGTLKL